MVREKEILSENIVKIIDAIGISDEDFGLICEVSRTTISNLKKGLRSSNLQTLQKIINLTSINLDELTKENFTPPKELREMLQLKYKNDLSKSLILNKTPSVPYILKYKLFETNFLHEYRERIEILNFIKQTFGYSISPNTLTKNLNRLETVLENEPNPTKNRGYRYKLIKYNK